MTKPHDILKRPVLTEKTAVDLEETGKLTFRVDRRATKHQIKNAFQEIFGVRVKRVNTVVMPSKPKRWGRIPGKRAGYKKAIVELAEGEELDLFMLGEQVGEDEGEV